MKTSGRMKRNHYLHIALLWRVSNWLTLESRNISTGKLETKIDPEISTGLLFSWLQQKLCSVGYREMSRSFPKRSTLKTNWCQNEINIYSIVVSCSVNTQLDQELKSKLLIQSALEIFLEKLIRGLFYF